MEKPKWQMGQVKIPKDLYDETFGHLADQFVWVRVHRPAYGTGICIDGKAEVCHWYTSHLRGWGSPYDLTLLGTDIVELLPYFLYDDPIIVPYKVWSDPNYQATTHPENMPLERP